MKLFLFFFHFITLFLSRVKVLHVFVPSQNKPVLYLSVCFESEDSNFRAAGEPQASLSLPHGNPVQTAVA